MANKGPFGSLVAKVTPKRKPIGAKQGYASAYSYGGTGTSGKTTYKPTGNNSLYDVDTTNPSLKKAIDLQNFFNQPQPAAPAQQPTNPYYPGSGGSGSGGGGGGGSAANNKRVQDLANSLFNLDVHPYDMMRQGITNERGQMNAYNPNFAGIAAPYDAQARAADAARRQSVTSALGQIGQVNQGLADTQAQAQARAMGDIGNMGGNVAPYLQQSQNAIGTRLAGLGDQTAYMGQLNALGSQGLADTLRTSGLIQQGGAANLAVNKGVMGNQLSQQEAQIALQQAQALQAQNQAKQEFLLKYMKV